MIDEIRDAGLLVCVYGASDTINGGTDGSLVDAVLKDGMVMYKEHSLYA